MTLPVTVLVTTRNEEANIGACLEAVAGRVEAVFVLDSESTDRTVEIARRSANRVETLAYDPSRIIPWIFQWGLDHLPIPTEWVLILEADQVAPPELLAEIGALLAAGDPPCDGYYIRRRQIFRGRWIRWGGYGSKHLLKLFRRSRSSLDPVEQDTRVYVRGPVGKLRHPLEEWNHKEDAIRFYLEKHLRYAEAFAREELARRQGRADWKAKPRLFGTPDERVLWMKSAFFRFPLYWRAFAYFVYRYFLRLGFLDGKEGFIFHFLQAFWFRVVIDIRLEELMRGPALAEDPEPSVSPGARG